MDAPVYVPPPFDNPGVSDRRTSHLTRVLSTPPAIDRLTADERAFIVHWLADMALSQALREFAAEADARTNDDVEPRS